MSIGEELGNFSRTRLASPREPRTEGIHRLGDANSDERRALHSAKGVPPNLRRLRPGHDASKGPRLAGREFTTPGSVPLEDPGGAWSPKPASPKRKCLDVLVAKIPWFDRLRSRIAHAHHVHIFVLVVLISVTPWPLRLLTTTISMHRLRGLVRSIRSLVLAAAGLLQTPANSRGWCAAHLRLSRRSSDGAPRIFCFVIGKLLLPAAMAEPRAAAQKADKEAPAKKHSTNMQGRPP